MKQFPPRAEQGEKPGVVFRFPRAHVLTRQQAAPYLGISEKRLRLLDFVGLGPPSVPPDKKGRHYRKEDLDQYCATLFAKAGLSAQELQRHRTQRNAVTYTGTDRFMELATRQELAQGCAYVGGRIAIGLGLLAIVLSHTPLSRVFFHMQ
ncbi:MAG: hypothetical protein ABF628_07210 [Acetobacter orientalis]|uniref:hypothetical protein n=1 Tax=Acetobacter orientalis TaxID=146474 RepID=UPI0039EB2207